MVQNNKPKCKEVHVKKVKKKTSKTQTNFLETYFQLLFISNCRLFKMLLEKSQGGVGKSFMCAWVYIFLTSMYKTR